MHCIEILPQESTLKNAKSRGDVKLRLERRKAGEWKIKDCKSADEPNAEVEAEDAVEVEDDLGS